MRRRWGTNRFNIYPHRRIRTIAMSSLPSPASPTSADRQFRHLPLPEGASEEAEGAVITEGGIDALLLAAAESGEDCVDVRHGAVVERFEVRVLVKNARENKERERGRGRGREGEMSDFSFSSSLSDETMGKTM